MKTLIRNLGAGVLASAVIAALTATAAQPLTASTGTVKLRKVLPTAGTQQMVAGSDRFIVRYVDGATSLRSTTASLARVNAAASRAMTTLASARSGSAALPSFRIARTMGTGAQVVRASRRLNAAESAEFLTQLRSDPNVKYAQVDSFKHRLDVTPNDPKFGTLQWDMSDPTVGLNTPSAWETSQGEGVIVAVLDTGVLHHTDLADNLVPGYDMVSYYGQTDGDDVYPDVAGDGDGRDDDPTDPGDWTDSSMDDWCGNVESSSWHGTHVAGTVAAVANNAFGIAGAAYGAKVQPVRVLGHCGGTTSDIADGITWASGGHVDGVPDNATPAEVINLSLGGPGSCEDDPVTQEAVDGAIARGTTVVVAAGNNGADAANYTPASCKGVITVGATGVSGEQSYFSNYGATVTVSAPGGDATAGNSPNNMWIWSLGDSGTTTAKNDNVLMGMIGTSQASPHVAAVVALMQAAAVSAGKSPLTPDQIKQILRSTAKPFLVTPASTKPAGTGIVDAPAAVLAATQDIAVEVAEPLTNRVAATGLTGAAGEGVLYSIEVPAGKTSLNLRTYGGTGDVSLYVSQGQAPTTTRYERKSAKAGNVEAVVVTRPAAGTWYVRVVGEAAFTNVSLMGVY